MFVSDSMNLYQYSSHNPVGFVDTNGSVTSLPNKSENARQSTLLGNRIENVFREFLEAVNELTKAAKAKPLDWEKRVTHRDPDGSKSVSDFFSKKANVGIDTKGRHEKNYDPLDKPAGLGSGDLSRAERRAKMSGAHKEHQVIIIADSTKDGSKAETMVGPTKNSTRSTVRDWVKAASDPQSKEARETINPSTTTLKRITEATRNVNSATRKLRQNAGGVGIIISAIFTGLAEDAYAKEASKNAENAFEAFKPTIQADLESDPKRGVLIVLTFETGRQHVLAAQITRFAGVTSVRAGTEDEAKQLHSQMKFYRSDDWYWFGERKTEHTYIWIPPADHLVPVAESR